MPSSYIIDISNGQSVFIFLIILKRWKGSLYKLVWVDLLIYIMAYYILNLSYRFAMNDQQKIIFEQIVKFCEKTKGDIPISFLLGFFVSGIISRWYQMYLFIPWMNQIALHVAANVNGRNEEGSRKVRLTVMRYMNLAWVLMMQLISDQIATRFLSEDDHVSVGSALKPVVTRRRAVSHKHVICRNTCHPWSIEANETTRSSRSYIQQQTKLDHSRTLSMIPPATPNNSEVLTPLAPLATEDEYGVLPDAFEANDVVQLREKLRAFNLDKKVRSTFGILITESEILSFERIAADWFRRTKTKYTPEYWIPMQWAQRVVLKAYESGYINDPKTAYYTIESIGRLRKQMQDLQVYSSIMIPLVYTQVVIIAVYSYFLCQIFACQFVENREGKEQNIDLYVPIFSIFSFLFLMGWLKVALCVMNPFGDDDEDFQTSNILDYNLEVSYRSVYMDPRTFPEHLSMPLGIKRKPDDTTPDDLEEFLETCEQEISKVADLDPTHDVSNLEMKPSRCEKARKLLCCEKQPPLREPAIYVTNSEYAEVHNTDTKPSVYHPSVKKWAWL